MPTVITYISAAILEVFASVIKQKQIKGIQIIKKENYLFAEIFEYLPYLSNQKKINKKFGHTFKYKCQNQRVIIEKDKEFCDLGIGKCFLDHRRQKTLKFKTDKEFIKIKNLSAKDIFRKTGKEQTRRKYSQNIY